MAPWKIVKMIFSIFKGAFPHNVKLLKLLTVLDALEVTKAAVYSQQKLCFKLLKHCCDFVMRT